MIQYSSKNNYINNNPLFIVAMLMPSEQLAEGCASQGREKRAWVGAKTCFDADER